MEQTLSKWENQYKYFTDMKVLDMERKQDDAGYLTLNSTDVKTEDEKNNKITMKELMQEMKRRKNVKGK